MGATPCYVYARLAVCCSRPTAAAAATACRTNKDIAVS